MNYQLIHDEGHRNPMTIQELEERMRAWLASGEYEAVLFSLEIVASKYRETVEINFFLDSELVVKQMNSEYKIKNEQLGNLLIKIKNLIIENDLKATFKHIPREKNHHADRLVNLAIDKELKKKK
jgi:ribonuclease HI